MDESQYSWTVVLCRQRVTRCYVEDLSHLLLNRCTLKQIVYRLVSIFLN